MRCPRCKAPMIIIERRQIELDHCLACQGVWFDGEELELLFADLGSEEMARALSRIMSLPHHESSEGRIRCPRCDKKMDHVEVPAKEPVVLDRCCRGDGIWFDAGELHAVVAYAAESDDLAAPALAFVQEVFPQQRPELDPDGPDNQPGSGRRENQPGSPPGGPAASPEGD